MALDSERLRNMLSQMRKPYSGGDIPTVGQSSTAQLKAWLTAQPKALNPGPSMFTAGPVGSTGVIPGTPPPNLFKPVSFAGVGPAPEIAGAAAPTLAAEAAGAATGVSRFAPVLTKASLAKGSGYAAAGLFAGSMLNKLNARGEGSNTDRALTGAATGAGIGAGVGSVVPIVGTGIGALTGAGVGAAINVFRPRTSQQSKLAKLDASTAKQLASLAALTADLPDDLRQAMADQLLAGAAEEKLKLTTKSKDPIEGLAAQIAAQIPAIKAQQRADTQAKLDAQQRQIGMQASIGAYMAPHLQRFIDTGEAAAQQYEALGRPELAATSRSSAARLSAAYAAQTQSYPALFDVQQQLGYARQVNQIRQQQSLQSLYGAQSGGTASLEQIAAG